MAARAAPAEAGARPGVVDERARGVDQVLADQGEASTAPPCAARDFDRVAVTTTCSAPAARPRDEAAAARTDDPERVRLVDDEDGAGLGGEGDEVVDRRGVAQHRVDRLDDDDGRGLSRRASSSATCSRSLCRATDTAARDRRHPSIRLAWACSSLTTSVPASARVVSAARFAAYPLESTRRGGAGQGRERRLELVVHVEGAGHQARGAGPPP